MNTDRDPEGSPELAGRVAKWRGLIEPVNQLPGWPKIPWLTPHQVRYSEQLSERAKPKMKAKRKPASRTIEIMGWKKGKTKQDEIARVVPCADAVYAYLPLSSRPGKMLPLNL